MLIIDFNAYLGRWPFRRLKYQGTDGLIALMDRAGIDKAVVTSFDSIFLIDYEVGNEEVADACLSHPDRFIPFAVINLDFPGWKEHLKKCVEIYRVKGVKLHPDYHKFSLTGAEMDELVKEVKRYNLPIFVELSVQDMRHHPPYCFVEETPITEATAMIEQYPDVKIVLGGGKHFWSRVESLLKALPPTCENYYIETSGIGGPFDGLRGLVEKIGGSRLIFGTRMPLLIPEAAKLNIEKSKISEMDKELILGGNAVKMLTNLP